MEVVFPVLGIPVVFSYFSLLMLALFAFSGFLYIKRQIGKKPAPEYITAGVIAALVVFFSIVLHEMAHGIVSTMLGHPIIEAGVSWWGAYVRPGIASYQEISPMEEILISIVGPLTNLLLFIAMAVIVAIFDESIFENTVQFAALVNWQLFVLNIVPLSFLGVDGSKVFDGFLRIFIESQSTRLSIELVASVLAIIWIIKWLGKQDSIAKMLEKI